MYAPAFRRLAGVTQVASPSEGHVFHNRLTHSLEVAQIARRLCARILDEIPAEAREAGLDAESPEICEAAALAHDLGHPPFGHIAETILGELADSHEASAGGFEGNAQSFRILTVLSPRKRSLPGLDLTQATLNATLKYPWIRGGNPSRADKWGAYASEAEDFAFARAGDATFKQSLEAAIMDFADDIAYSTHDLIDFFRAGLIPPFSDLDIADEIDHLKQNPHIKIVPAAIDTHLADIEDVLTIMSAPRFTGTWDEVAHLSTSTSRLITYFTTAVNLARSNGQFRIEMDASKRARIAFLKHLVWRYVILNPRLATQQAGQERMIRDLFEIYLAAMAKGNTALLPREFDKWFGPPGEKLEGDKAVRLVVDIIASFTDHQAWLVHRRLTGASPGSLGEALYA